MERSSIQDKLKKIKALADKTEGKEHESAMQFYQKLLDKYGIDQSEIIEEPIQKIWFTYDDQVDKKLLTQIFYTVTGCDIYYEKTDKRRHIIAVECTEFECSQIIFYYQFYKEHLKSELSLFLSAFFSVNDLFPDDNARCKSKDTNKKEYTQEEIDRILRVVNMKAGIKKKTPYKQIDTNKD